MSRHDLIWYKDIAAFFCRDNLLKFFPTACMSIVGQLNAVFRFCIYYAIIMVALTRNVQHAIVILAGALITAAVRELAYKGGKVDIDELNGDRLRNKCTQPSKENPYMNLQVFDPSDKAPACKQWAIGSLPAVSWQGACHSTGPRRWPKARERAGRRGIEPSSVNQLRERQGIFGMYGLGGWDEHVVADNAGPCAA